MKYPNFFIVGAAKAGTTSLYYYLKKHPDVYMSPVKEPHYFSKDIRCKNFNSWYRRRVCIDLKSYLSKTDMEEKHVAFIESEVEYLQLFKDVTSEKIVGEVSNGYLYSNVAAGEIYEYNPKAKIVIILRNPIERAFSHWLMDLRDSNVCRDSFLKAIQSDVLCEDSGWGKSHLYVELGLYYEQVKRFIDVFPEDQILVFLYDDLKKEPSKLLKSLCDFLGISLDEDDVLINYNKASIPRFASLNSFVKNFGLDVLARRIISEKNRKLLKSIITNTDKLPELSLEDKYYTLEYFSDNIDMLEELLGIDLSAWRI